MEPITRSFNTGGPRCEAEAVPLRGIIRKQALATVVGKDRTESRRAAPPGLEDGEENR